MIKKKEILKYPNRIMNEKTNKTIFDYFKCTALLAVANTMEESKERLQQAVNNVIIWTKNGELNLTRPNRLR